MTAEIIRDEEDHGDEIFVEEVVIRPVGIPIRDIRVLARLEEN